MKLQKMKNILCIWRKDIKHEKFGGSEIVIHEYLKWLSLKWYNVTQISTNSRNNPSEEIIDWIKIIRKFTIHYIYFAFWYYYITKLRGKYDIIIDHAGGIPMLTPRYEYKKPIIFFTHHIWNKERSEYFHQWIKMWWIGNVFGWIYNNIILKSYKHKKTITVSKSTADELSELWFDHIYILPNTTNVKIMPLTKNPKENIITIIGRITPNKRIDHAIQVIKQLKDKWYMYKLNIIGNQQDKIEYEKLLKLVIEYDLSDNIIWHGIVSDDKRNSILDNSKYLLITSIKEWFGVVILEANARWVPAIGYDIWWVRDTICNSKNGILIKNEDISWITSFIINTDDKQYQELAKDTNIYISNYPKQSDNVDKFEKILLDKIE